MRINDRLWRAFEAWCTARRLRVLPAHPWTVAAYLRWCERHRPSTAIADALRSIGRAHVLQCYRSPVNHPIITRTCKVIVARAAVRGQSADLFDADMADANAPKRKKPRKPARQSKRRTLRSTPKLVERR